MTASNSTKNIKVIYAGYLLAALAIFLPEASWQLGGLNFNTYLFEQWTGFQVGIVLVICFVLHVVLSKNATKKVLIPTLIAGLHSLGFAIFKLVSFQNLGKGFQQADVEQAAAVSAGMAIYILAISGLLMIIGVLMPYKPMS